MACLPEYAELHCLSNFSFLRGASHAQELIGRAAGLGYAALAITDECSLAGIVRAHVAAKERSFKPCSFAATWARTTPASEHSSVMASAA